MLTAVNQRKGKNAASAYGPERLRVRIAEADRVKRDIESQIEERLHDAVGDLYRRLGEAVERVSERLQEDDEVKPLVFRDSMIGNIRELVDVVPRLNIFGDETLAQLCSQVKDRVAGVKPDALRPSKTFDPSRATPLQEGGSAKRYKKIQL